MSVTLQCTALSCPNLLHFPECEPKDIYTVALRALSEQGWSTREENDPATALCPTHATAATQGEGTA